MFPFSLPLSISLSLSPSPSLSISRPFSRSLSLSLRFPFLLHFLFHFRIAFVYQERFKVRSSPTVMRQTACLTWGAPPSPGSSVSWHIFWRVKWCSRTCGTTKRSRAAGNTALLSKFELEERPRQIAGVALNWNSRENVDYGRVDPPFMNGVNSSEWPIKKGALLGRKQKPRPAPTREEGVSVAQKVYSV